MANDVILTPGGSYQNPTSEQDITQYLKKDNFLSEYETEEEKAVVRENLDVYAKDSVYNRQESDSKLNESIKKAFDKYLGEEDPHGILSIVTQMIEDFVRDDGTTPFKAPQAGVDPIQDFHLTTKRFVTKILKDHVNEQDPHRILPIVEDLLEQYVKQSEVYFKDQVYTKDEIDKSSGNYLKRDGTTPFTKAQIGMDPQIDSHLSTKRYVDKEIYNHLTEVDPHGFISILNNRLASYAKASNVYDKSQTYSRIQLDSIIRGLVNDAAREVIVDHLNAFDPHNILAEVRNEKYVKQDGSKPFKNPQKGVDAVDPNDLTTLRQVQASIKKVEDSLSEAVENNKCNCEWKTTGPVIGSAGLVNTGDIFADTVSLQEIMDAIFYGKGISINSPELGYVGNSVDVTVCVQGSMASFEHGELFQNGKLLHIFTREDFIDQSCITISSDVIKEDTEFVFKVFYMNGASHEVSSWTKLSMPVFVGLLPKWKFGNTVTYDYLMQLYREDPINNKFYDRGKNIVRIDHKYNFQDSSLQHIFLAIPEDYPPLYQLQTPSQQFHSEAFDIIDRIPFQVPGSDKDVIYKLYIYREALTQLNVIVNFNFETGYE